LTPIRSNSIGRTSNSETNVNSQRKINNKEDLDANPGLEKGKINIFNGLGIHLYLRKWEEYWNVLW